MRIRRTIERSDESHSLNTRVVRPRDARHNTRSVAFSQPPIRMFLFSFLPFGRYSRQGTMAMRCAALYCTAHSTRVSVSRVASPLRSESTDKGRQKTLPLPTPIPSLIPDYSYPSEWCKGINEQRALSHRRPVLRSGNLRKNIFRRENTSDDISE